MTHVLIDRELLERLLYSNSPARFDATEHNAARAELFAILANPTQQAEAVAVVAYMEGNGRLWNDTTHPGRMTQLMTVARHQRILADMRQQRDKLTELLREVNSAYTTAIHWEDMRAAMAQIKTALSELTP